VPGILGIAGAFVVAAISATSGPDTQHLRERLYRVEMRGGRLFVVPGLQKLALRIVSVRCLKRAPQALAIASLKQLRSFLNPKRCFSFWRCSRSSSFTSAHFYAVHQTGRFLRRTGDSGAWQLCLARQCRQRLVIEPEGFHRRRVSGVTFAGFGVLMASASR
jgi:hypothetical protein